MSGATTLLGSWVQDARVLPGLPRALRVPPARHRVLLSVPRARQPRAPPGIGRHTPASVHYGTAQSIRDDRGRIFDAAYAERLVNQAPTPLRLPEPSWINKPVQLAQISGEEIVSISLTGSAFGCDGPPVVVRNVACLHPAQRTRPFSSRLTVGMMLIEAKGWGMPEAPGRQQESLDVASAVERPGPKATRAVHPLLGLQRTVGNRTTAGLVAQWGDRSDARSAAVRPAALARQRASDTKALVDQFDDLGAKEASSARAAKTKTPLPSKTPSAARPWCPTGTTPSRWKPAARVVRR